MSVTFLRILSLRGLAAVRHSLHCSKICVFRHPGPKVITFPSLPVLSYLSLLQWWDIKGYVIFSGRPEKFPGSDKLIFI